MLAFLDSFYFIFYNIISSLEEYVKIMKFFYKLIFKMIIFKISKVDN